MDFIYWLDEVFTSLSDWLAEFAEEVSMSFTNVTDEITEILHNLNVLMQTLEIYIGVSGVALGVILIMLIISLVNQSKIKKELKATNAKLELLIPKPEEEAKEI